MAKRKLAVAEDFPLEGLSGGRPPSISVIRGGLTHLQRALDQEVKQRVIRNRALARATEAQRMALAAVPGLRDAQTLKSLRDFHRRNVRAELRVPRTAREPNRVYLGSFGATISPNYAYQWAAEASQGRRYSDTKVSPRASEDGSIGFSLFNSSTNFTASVRAGVGIYFRPMTNRYSLLDISADPALSYRWWSATSIDPVYNAASIGWYVARYNLNGSYDGPACGASDPLWEDNSFWFGASDSKSDPAHHLFARFPVDRFHFYVIWLFVSGAISTSGWSWAGSEMMVTIPSITWLLH